MYPGFHSPSSPNYQLQATPHSSNSTVSANRPTNPSSHRVSLPPSPPSLFSQPHPHPHHHSFAAALIVTTPPPHHHPPHHTSSSSQHYSSTPVPRPSSSHSPSPAHNPLSHPVVNYSSCPSAVRPRRLHSDRSTSAALRCRLTCPSRSRTSLYTSHISNDTRMENKRAAEQNKSW